MSFHLLSYEIGWQYTTPSTSRLDGRQGHSNINAGIIILSKHSHAQNTQSIHEQETWTSDNPWTKLRVSSRLVLWEVNCHGFNQLFRLRDWETSGETHEELKGNRLIVCKNHYYRATSKRGPQRATPTSQSVPNLAVPTGSQDQREEEKKRKSKQ